MTLSGGASFDFPFSAGASFSLPFSAGASCGLPFSAGATCGLAFSGGAVLCGLPLPAGASFSLPFSAGASCGLPFSAGATRRPALFRGGRPLRPALLRPSLLGRRHLLAVPCPLAQGPRFLDFIYLQRAGLRLRPHGGTAGFLHQRTGLPQFLHVALSERRAPG